MSAFNYFCLNVIFRILKQTSYFLDNILTFSLISSNLLVIRLRAEVIKKQNSCLLT